VSDDRLTKIPERLRPFVERAISAAEEDDRIVGLTIGGSAIDGTMDDFSDLDFVVVLSDEAEMRDRESRRAFAESLGPLLSAITGEHVREPRLHLCLYGPPLTKIDIKFVTVPDLALRVEDGVIAWERHGVVTAAYARSAATWPRFDPEWAEERFWTWIYTAATKIGRGELLACVEEIAFLRRAVIGPLMAQGCDRPANGVRRLETIAPELTPALNATLGGATAEECVRALRATTELYKSIRGLIDTSPAEGPVIEYLDEIERGVIRQSLGEDG
jgi:hypothetical protein